MVQIDIKGLLVKHNKSTASLQWSIVFLPKTNLQENLIMKKHQTKPNEGAFHSYWVVLFQTIEDNKEKVGLRNCSRLEKLRGNQTHASVSALER